MTPWYIWLICGLIVLSSCLTVTHIGKPRTPITPGVALGIILTNAVIVYAILAASTPG